MTLTVLEPATEAVLAELPRAGPDDADAAVARAKAAYPAWRAVAPPDRARLLYGLADALAERQEELAVLEARNAGKPIGDARGEMGMVVDVFRYYAGAVERNLGDTIPVTGGVAMTFREPLGVVALITPWNFPLTIAAWKLGPCLAAGNTVVLKPAELTPLTALELERGQWRQLGRLEHHRVAGGERRRELPRRDREREVPRHDQRDDAERLAERHRHAARHRDRIPERALDRARVEPERVHDHDHLAARVSDRLARVARLEHGQVLEPRLQRVGQPEQQLRAVGRRDRAPARVGGLGARDGRVGLLDARARDLGEHGLRGRLEHDQGHTRSLRSAR